MAVAKSQYRRVPRYLWNDPRFRRMGVDAQFLYLYLWTSPQSNATGIINATPAVMALAHGWPLERAETALMTLCDAGLADVDSEAGLVALDFLEFDGPDNGKMILHWGACLADVPASPVITRALDRLKAHCEQRGKGFLEAFRALMRELPQRFHAEETVCHTVSDTVSDTVSGGYANQIKEEEELIKTSPTSGSGSGARARARATAVPQNGPERIGAIMARMGDNT